MIADGTIGASTQIAAVVVPVAVYFLILGLLNSRSRPQLLSGRLDFALLIVALGPLFVLPVLRCWGLSAPVVLSAVGAVAAVAMLVPRPNTWVIYNLRATDARDAVERALRSIAVDFRANATGFAFSNRDGRLRIGEFPLLRNVTVRLDTDDDRLGAKFESALGLALADYRTEASPMAVSLLLVATAMLVAPLAMVAHRLPEIVRLLTNLLP